MRRWDPQGRLIRLPLVLPYGSSGANQFSDYFLPAAGTFASTRGYRMPGPGSVVAHTHETNITVATSGNVSFQVLKNNAIIEALDLVADSSEGTGDFSKAVTVGLSVARFVAGDRIQAFATASGTMEWTNSVGLIFVMLDRVS